MAFSHKHKKRVDCKRMLRRKGDPTSHGKVKRLPPDEIAALEAGYLQAHEEYKAAQRQAWAKITTPSPHIFEDTS